ncbi:hypothetical protein [Tunturiibacter lichenicola]|uniref:hypothetical protein n=1 Tax=Tunturiibacter lichenicola TaxID=2051959 RepID=UPI003D9BEE34
MSHHLHHKPPQKTPSTLNKNPAKITPTISHHRKHHPTHFHLLRATRTPPDGE